MLEVSSEHGPTMGLHCLGGSVYGEPFVSNSSKLFTQVKDREVAYSADDMGKYQCPT